jgi:hypothetical protein
MGSDKIMAGVRDLVQRTGEGQARSGTRWPDDREVEWRCVWSSPCTRRWGAHVSWFDLKTKVDGFSRFDLKTGGFLFPDLGLKTGSYDFMIWASKLPQQCLGLGLKNKRVMVYRLCHKTDKRMKMTRDTHRDLVACFVWKQVRLEFTNLASRLVEARCGWCMWHLRRDHVKIKLKTDGSMWQAASFSCTPTLPFSLYYALEAL